MFARRRMILAACVASAGMAVWFFSRRSDRAVETPTRMELFIEPHRGIGPVSFGMTRAEVAVVMDAIGGGSPIPRGMNVDCFFDNSFQIAFGDAGHADFIEISSSMPVPVLYSGRDVRDTPADELLALIQLSEPADPELSGSEEYVFSKQILALWGPDTQYDYLGGRKRAVFATVAIGGPTYLAAIRAIRKR